MRTFTLNLLTLSLGLALMPLALAANSPQQRQLLEQVRLGESTQREDLVRQSLASATCYDRAIRRARKKSWIA